MYVQWAIFVSRKSKENTSIEIIDIFRFSLNNHYGVIMGVQLFMLHVLVEEKMNAPINVCQKAFLASNIKKKKKKSKLKISHRLCLRECRLCRGISAG